MAASLLLSPEVNVLSGRLQEAVIKAIKSIPPLPAAKDLAVAQIGGDFFSGQVTLTVSPAPAFEAWAAKLITKLEAFSK
jgi:hypothetical protein